MDLNTDLGHYFLHLQTTRKLWICFQKGTNDLQWYVMFIITFIKHFITKNLGTK